MSLGRMKRMLYVCPVPGRDSGMGGRKTIARSIDYRVR